MRFCTFMFQCDMFSHAALLFTGERTVLAMQNDIFVLFRGRMLVLLMDELMVSQCFLGFGHK